MNSTTKNDLSAGIVKLDYQALLETATIAYVMVRDQLARQLNETYDFQKSGAGVYGNAESIMKLGKDLAIAADTYIALKHGLEREEKVIINA